jgi:signal peptidase complex subunit 3
VQRAVPAVATMTAMDSYTNRGSTIFTAWTTCLGFFAVLNHLTYYRNEPVVAGEVAAVHIEDLTLNQQFGADQLNVAMNISADFLPELRNWNMKLLFAYVVAEYETPEYGRNLITIWDQPVKSMTKANLVLPNVMNEYPVRDKLKELKGRNITLQLRYRTVPIIGWLFTKDLIPGFIEAPMKYFRKMDEAKEKEKKQTPKVEVREKASKASKAEAEKEEL